MARTSRGALFVLFMSVSAWMHPAISLRVQSKSTEGDGGQTHAPWVSCYGKTGEHFIGSKDERTPVLTSPNKIYRVYAEIHAQKDPVEQCKNRADLFISVRGSPFKLVFTETASQRTAPRIPSVP